MVLLLLALLAQAPDLSRWVDYVREEDPVRLRERIRRQPERARAAARALLDGFDSSIHSHRDRPAQRRVRYSQELLSAGLELGRALAQVTGDESFRRRFEARQQRIEATRLLNDREYEKALELLQSARRSAGDDPRFQFSTFLSSAYARLQLNRLNEALADCERALARAREIGEESQLALALYNLGAAHLHLTQYDQAARFSRRAVTAAEAAGNRLWQANAYLNLGTAEMQRGRFEKADKELRQALQLGTAVGDSLVRGRALFNLGLLYHRTRRWEMARDRLEESLAIIRAMDIRHSHAIDGYNYVEADALHALLECHEQLGSADAERMAEIRERLAELAELKRLAAQGH